MATRIAIIGRTRDAVTAAFYYDAAVKRVPRPGFAPAYRGLEAASVTACTSGAMIETVQTVNFSGWNREDLEIEFQNIWARGQADVLADSAATFDTVGRVWNGSVWA